MHFLFYRCRNLSPIIRSPHSQVIIRPGKSDLKPGEIVYTPTRGEEIIEQKLDNLLRYLNEQIGENEDPGSIPSALRMEHCLPELIGKT